MFNGGVILLLPVKSGFHPIQGDLATSQASLEPDLFVVIRSLQAVTSPCILALVVLLNLMISVWFFCPLDLRLVPHLILFLVLGYTVIYSELPQNLDSEQNLSIRLFEN